eukprot:scaffold6397_cov121-Isochrysis_galbana.AAC.7
MAMAPWSIVHNDVHTCHAGLFALPHVLQERRRTYLCLTTLTADWPPSLLKEGQEREREREKRGRAKGETATAPPEGEGSH